MNLLVLGPPNRTLLEFLMSDGNTVVEMEDPVVIEFIQKNNIDIIISFGYRHIIRRPVLDLMKDRIINLHISYLPWNRGADPNLWSFLEDTPKGVSIHLIDEGIDTGDIIAQRKVRFEIGCPTLATTYERLQDEVLCLFKEQWPSIAKGKFEAFKQPTGGSFHKLSDKDRFMCLLTEGWDTPVELLRGKALIVR